MRLWWAAAYVSHPPYWNAGITLPATKLMLALPNEITNGFPKVWKANKIGHRRDKQSRHGNYIYRVNEATENYRESTQSHGTTRSIQGLTVPWSFYAIRMTACTSENSIPIACYNAISRVNWIGF